MHKMLWVVASPETWRKKNTTQTNNDSEEEGKTVK